MLYLGVKWALKTFFVFLFQHGIKKWKGSKGYEYICEPPYSVYRVAALQPAAFSQNIHVLNIVT